MAASSTATRGRVSQRPLDTPQDNPLDPINIQKRIRQANISAAWDAYNGRFPDSIKQKKNQPNFNLKVNLIKAPVRKTNAFLFGQDFGVEVKPVNKLLNSQIAEIVPGQPEDQAQTFLDEFWEENEKLIKMQKGARYGSVTGDCFMKLVVDPGALFPRLVVLDPQCVDVETRPDDCDTPIKFVVSYQAMDNQVLYDYQQRITLDESGQSWTVQDWRRPAKDGGAWTAASDPQPWSYPFPPIFHAPDTINPGSYHGCPAITEDVIHLNHAYNFILSALYKAAHFFGSPKTVGKGFKKSEIPADPEDMLILPSKESQLDLLESKVDFAGGLQLADRLEAALHKLLSVNGMSLGDLADVPKGQIAALAIQLLFQVLIDLTNERRLTYGQMISNICSAVLQIAGYGVKRRVKINWPQMLPIDYASAAQAAIAAEQAGMSKKTALELILGVDADIEEQRSQEEGPTMAETLLGAFNRGQDIPQPQPQPAMAGGE